MSRPQDVPFDLPLGNRRSDQPEFWRLSDPAPSAALKAWLETVKANPQIGRDWLLENGFITPNGRWAPQYGG